MKIVNYCQMIILVIGAFACAGQRAQEESSKTEVRTPVTIAGVEFSTIDENIILNATSVYLRKNEIRSNVSGHVFEVNASIGDRVKAGTVLFRMKTKEAEALGKLAEEDTAYAVRGELALKAPSGGIITAVMAQSDSYLNDGDAVAIVADEKSFAFILHVPFELRKFAGAGKGCRILLPDSTELDGTVSAPLAEMDAASQTQSYVVIPRLKQSLPENLVAQVFLRRKTSENARLLPKSCILSDETMQNFWVMKLLNDSMAVKVPVIKGISGDDLIEITFPELMPGDRFVSSGSYGLPDTAKITISRLEHE